MTAAWEAWLDRLAGEKPTVENFARSALKTPPRIEITVRYPANESMWPPETWDLMQRIQRGEAE